MEQPTLILRADANTRIGTGHITRCLALADEWRRRGGKVVLVTCDLPFNIQCQIVATGITVKQTNLGQAYELIDIAKAEHAEWIVLDGYGFDEGYQKEIKDAGYKLLVIDDFGSVKHYYADLILNQNIFSNLITYKNCEPYTQVLRGLKYLLLRKEFTVQKIREFPKFAQNILVTFGGSDPDNITLKVVELLKQIDRIIVTVCVGGNNPNLESIKQSINGNPAYSIVVNSSYISEYMRWCDFAISAGGTTCYELIATKCPSIIIPIAENQNPVAGTMQTRRLAEVMQVSDLDKEPEALSFIKEIIESSSTRVRLSTAMEGLIDGKGTARAVNMMALKLRKVKQSDCFEVWGWVNEEEYRRQSFEQKYIPLDLHKEWFEKAVNDDKVVYYIATLNGDAIGQARYHRDVKEGSAIISILVAKAYRGMSLGSAIIKKTTEEFFEETTDDIVHAYVRPGNYASINSFLEAGYTNCGETTEHFGIPTKHFTKQRDESW